MLRTGILLFDDFTPRSSFRAAATFEADGKGTEGTEGILANEGIAGMEGNESDDTFVDIFTASALRVKRTDLPFDLDGTPAIGVVDVDDESTSCPEAFRCLDLRLAKTVLANIFTAMGVVTECERGDLAGSATFLPSRSFGLFETSAPETPDIALSRLDSSSMH